ncbi:MAG: hypothetical protein PHN82_02970 [bacterium]|nr:hypothetical protein [bacterium]
MNTRWTRRRERLLASRIDRLGLSPRRGPLAGCIAALGRELARAGIRFRPRCYLSNSWGCPDLVPLIGIPFHLARPDLARLHREMGYDVEERAEIMRLLRHEAGHAICYAHGLHRRRDWREVFGPFHKAYCDHFIPDPFSRQHVTHARHYYAQKHPDEDFAEAFAVWLAPGSRWRERYAGSPALRKLLFVDRLMREVGPLRPAARSGPKDVPVSEMRFTLGDYYGHTPEGHRAAADAYAERIIRRVFPLPRVRGAAGAGAFIRSRARMLAEPISFWSGVPRGEVEEIARSLAGRAERRAAPAPGGRRAAALVELSSLLTFIVFSRLHTRRLPLPLDRHGRHRPAAR